MGALLAVVDHALSTKDNQTMYWYHVVFLIILNPWVVLGFLALSVWLYSGPGAEPTDAEVKAHRAKAEAEVRGRNGQ